MDSSASGRSASSLRSKEKAGVFVFFFLSICVLARHELLPRGEEYLPS